MAKQVLHEGRFLRFVNNGGWEYVERCRTSGVIAIVALSRDRKVILVEQFRPPINARTIETPAGLAGDIVGQEHESLEIAARRELEEESGYTGGRWQELGTSASSAGLTTEMITFFSAVDVERTSAGGGDASENIIVHEIPLTDLRNWLATKAAEGLIVDHKIYAGLTMAGIPM